MSTVTRRRVALVVSHLRGGGKEQCIVDLANGLAGGEFEPLIVCLGAGGPLEARIRRDRVGVVLLGKRAGNDVRIPMRLAAALRRERVEVVHSNNWGTLGESLLAARLSGVRHVVHTQHGLDYGASDAPSDGRHRLRMLVKRVAARGLARVAAVSDEVRGLMVRGWRVPPERVVVIHNGVAIRNDALDAGARRAARRALGLGGDDLVVGSVGIFRPVKDYPTLVEAMAGVVAELPQARLVLVGDGPSRPEIEAAVRRSGLGRRVLFLGLRLDVAALLPLLDVFALCSVSEGISLSILEAMERRLPVVATAVGGNAEIVDTESVGLLVPPRSPSLLADALITLLRDEGRRRDIGARARARVESRFSLARMTADYERLYAGLSR